MFLYTNVSSKLGYGLNCAFVCGLTVPIPRSLYFLSSIHVSSTQ